MYDRFYQLPLLIEGPEFDTDYSYYLVDKCQEMKELEKGIILEGFKEESESREKEMEFRIL
jgi:hypothetical protein